MHNSLQINVLCTFLPRIKDGVILDSQGDHGDVIAERSDSKVLNRRTEITSGRRGGQECQITRSPISIRNSRR